MKEEFTIKDIIQILAIPRDKFKEWVFRNYIKPTQKAEGPGYSNKYSRLDLYAIKIFDDLVKNGFHRRRASSIVNFFLKMTEIEQLDISNKYLFLVFFERPFKSQTMKSKDPKRPYITKKGKIVSDKALSPDIRIITDKDVKKSFETLFLTLDDTELSAKFEIGHLNFNRAHIIDFKKLKTDIDTFIKSIY
jgi:hypothetical protein